MHSPREALHIPAPQQLDRLSLQRHFPGTPVDQRGDDLLHLRREDQERRSAQVDDDDGYQKRLVAQNLQQDHTGGDDQRDEEDGRLVGIQDRELLHQIFDFIRIVGLVGPESQAHAEEQIVLPYGDAPVLAAHYRTQLADARKGHDVGDGQGQEPETTQVLQFLEDFVLDHEAELIVRRKLIGFQLVRE